MLASLINERLINRVEAHNNVFGNACFPNWKGVFCPISGYFEMSVKCPVT
jgi:hypothetical protein